MIVCLVVIPDFRGIALKSGDRQDARPHCAGQAARYRRRVLELLQPVHVVCRGA
jgi:hypothetical protein